MSDYRTPLKRARGLGSAKEGVTHWWRQRLTALALVPLVVWLVYSLAVMAGTDYAAFVDWLSRPYAAVALVIFVAVLYYHSALGLQVVIEDYVHTPWRRLSLIIAAYFVNIALAAVSVLAIIQIALGAGSA
jgi:succinate dehydrogenase / fumarate reductase membrane anchor subunit